MIGASVVARTDAEEAGPPPCAETRARSGATARGSRGETLFPAATVTTLSAGTDVIVTLDGCAARSARRPPSTEAPGTSATTTRSTNPGSGTESPEAVTSGTGSVNMANNPAITSQRRAPSAGAQAA